MALAVVSDLYILHAQSRDQPRASWRVIDLTLLGNRALGFCPDWESKRVILLALSVSGTVEFSESLVMTHGAEMWTADECHGETYGNQI